MGNNQGQFPSHHPHDDEDSEGWRTESSESSEDSDLPALPDEPGLDQLLDHPDMDLVNDLAQHFQEEVPGGMDAFENFPVLDLFGSLGLDVGGVPADPVEAYAEDEYALPNTRGRNAPLALYTGKASLYHATQKRKITGRGMKAFRDLPNDPIRKAVSKQEKEMPVIVEELSMFHVCRHLTEVNAIVKDLMTHVGSGEQHLAPLREAIVRAGGCRVVEKVLLDAWKLKPSVLTQEICLYSLGILRSLFFQVLGAVDPYVDDDLLLRCTFELLFRERTNLGNRGLDLFTVANEVTEELLASRTKLFDLSPLHQLPSFVAGLSAHRLVSFCRVTSFIAFGQEEKQPPQLIEQSRDKKYHESQRILDRNHAILVQTPVLLERLVKIVAYAKNALVKARAISQSLHSHAPNAFTTHQIEELMHNLNVFPTWDYPVALPETVPKAAPRPPLDSEEPRPQTIAERVRTIASCFQVEVLFVLCSLLSSKRGAQACKQVVAHRLIPALRMFMEEIDWRHKKHAHDENNQPMHGPGCECSPEDTLKTQFLRLLHTLSDNGCDLDKNLMLSKEELIECGLEVNPLDDFRRSPGPQGILSYLVSILMNEPADSTHRYWLLFPIEGFLRCALPEHQLFIARQGLLKHILGHILSAGFKTAGSYQMNFDLLGELLKFNRDTFVLFNSLLTEEQFASLGNIVINNLVDSNVFLRAVVLSVYKFACDNAKLAGKPVRKPPGTRMYPSLKWQTRVLKARNERPPVHYDLSVCWGAQFIATNRIRLLHDLMGLVNVKEMTQTNVCCLNSGLIMLILLESQGELVESLEAVRTFSSKGPGALETFYHLLQFWEGYYIMRGHDSAKLELSSEIHFSEWCRVVRLLLGPEDVPTSLRYYTKSASDATSDAAGGVGEESSTPTTATAITS